VRRPSTAVDGIASVRTLFYLDGLFGSSLSVAPPAVDADGQRDEYDGDEDSAERDDDLDPGVERPLDVHDDAARQQGRRAVVTRRLELEVAVGGAGRIASRHT